MSLITAEVIRAIPELPRAKVGNLHVFCQHTSAGLTLNENADSDVRRDLADALARLSPPDARYRHTVEGPDDMPAHVLTSLVGSSLTIPVGSGRLLLGTWQGIYLCEFRAARHARRLVLTLAYEC